MEFPHLLRLIERQPVRHDLPRALLVLLVPDRVAACSRRTACGCSTSRSCRRTAARCASTAATPTTATSRERPSGARAARRASGARASTTSRPTASFARAACSEDKRGDPRSSSSTSSAQGKPIAGYGAPAKGNTLLNYCGIGTDFLDYTVDLNPHKQGHLLPGHAHPDPLRRGAARDAARRRADPALEPARRDRRAARATSASGAGGSRRAPPSCACCREARRDRRWPASASIEPERHRRRARLLRAHLRREQFAARIDPRRAVQHVVQRARRDTLRGMHYQAEPHGEAKLVRCTRGAIFDVAVDLRPDSPTLLRLARRRAERGQRRGAAASRAGFAHGFQTLDRRLRGALPDVPRRTCPAAARGVRWDDPAFGIAWPEPPPGGRVMNERDAGYPDV